MNDEKIKFGVRKKLEKYKKNFKKKSIMKERET